MFCKKCGKQLKDGVQFCGCCGEKVEMPEQSVQTEEKASAPKARHVKIPAWKTEDADHPKSDGNRDVSRHLPLITAGIVVIAVVITAMGRLIPSDHSGEPDEDVAASPVIQEKETEPEPEQSSSIDNSEDSTEDLSEQEMGSEDPEESEESIPEEPAEEIDEEVNEEGIHTYDLIVRDVTWTEAYEDCLSRGGHLVRINSDDEYQAILQQISAEEKDNVKFWLGGTRGFADSYDYHWIYEDGSYGDEILDEDDKYSSYWLSGEPSYEDEAVGSQEMYMNMFYMGREGRWVWNDVPDDLIAVVNTYSGTVGYICEYED